MCLGLDDASEVSILIASSNLPDLYKLFAY